jgi:hypothetical protein
VARTTSRYDGAPGALDRLALACGAGWVVAALVGNGLTESEAPTEDTPAAAQAYFALLRTGSHRFGLGLELLGLCLLVVFVAKVFAVLRQAQGPDGWLPGLALAGGIVTVTIKLASAAPYLVGLTVKDLPADQARLLVQLGDAAFLVTAMTSGLLVLGIAGSALASGVLPRWLALLGLPIGTLAVLGSLVPSSLDGGPGVGGFLLGLLWVLVTSSVLALRRAAPVDLGSHEAVLTRA